MIKRSLTLCLFLFVSVVMMAQTFSFSKAQNGFAYNEKGSCLIQTDPKDASISFSTAATPLKDYKCYKVTSYTDGKMDTTIVKSSDLTLSSDSLTLTIKNTSANIGYYIIYGDSSCNFGIPCNAFTWITEFQPIDTIQFTKDSVICSDLELHFTPLMTYFSEDGRVMKVKRTLQVSYQSFLKNEDNPGIGTVNDIYEEHSYITLEQMPYENTVFVVTDTTDKAHSYKITTDTFYTQAVVAYPKISTAASFAHEADEGVDTASYFDESLSVAKDNSTKFRSSGPLSLNLISQANSFANHFEWSIVKDDDINEGSFRNGFVLFENNINSYVFSDPGNYCIELTVSNIKNDSVCEHKSYFCLSIAESALQIPNTFTPNGDGINDEFRVAYRSIESFECNIYDRWGRCVYKSNDITQGWDGSTGSKTGSVGTYYYVIEAKGTDGIEYKKKGTINLIRGK